jgi:hypothetical protein
MNVSAKVLMHKAFAHHAEISYCLCIRLERLS